MLSPVEKLRKFHVLEQKRNFDNRAVTGGLEKFLPVWQKESSTAGVSEEINIAVTAFLTEYAEKDTDGRRESVAVIFAILPPPEPRPARENFRQDRQNVSNSGNRGAEIRRRDRYDIY